MEAFFHDPKAWVAVAFFIFLAGFYKLALPFIIGALDKRAKDIQHQLDEAVRLREEAQAILAQYQLKKNEMEAEAENILHHAKQEASAMKANAEAALKDAIKRRTKMAEDKIARAEADAVAHMKATMVEVAANTAKAILIEQMADQDDALIDNALKDIDRIVH